MHLPCLASSAALASHLHDCCCLQGVEPFAARALADAEALALANKASGEGRGLGCLGLGRGACRAVTCSTMQQGYPGLSLLLSDYARQKHARCPGVAVECSVLVIIMIAGPQARWSQYNGATGAGVEPTC